MKVQFSPLHETKASIEWLFSACEWEALHGVCACLCFVCDDPPCPSGSVVQWWARRLLYQRSCPAGTHRRGGAPTLASHPPWLTSSQHNHTTGAEKDRKNILVTCVHLVEEVMNPFLDNNIYPRIWCPTCHRDVSKQNVRMWLINCHLHEVLQTWATAPLRSTCH